MKRYENLAFQELLRSVMSVYRERKDLYPIAWPFLEHLQTEAACLFGKDELDETGFYEVLHDCGRLINAMKKSSRSYPKTTEAFRFHCDAITLLPVYHRESMNATMTRAAFFLQESLENYRQQVFDKKDLDGDCGVVYDEFQRRLTAFLSNCKGGARAAENYVQFLEQREKLIEKYLLRGLTGEIARKYWSGILYPELSNNELVQSHYAELKYRVFQITSDDGLPEARAHGMFDQYYAIVQCFKALKGCLSFLAEVTRLASDTHGPTSVFCETELNLCNDFVASLEQSIDRITTLDCTELYSACAMVRARLSSIA